eukprot:gb/GFBE01074719.1/.p1 GENE.gb/GFBE01074719.1/~~gb/GFBE01074719.1/.p1  ORF type:complete len:1134 (+),score=302.11 gb/GFBE01074719.1/:1-3402(+)
MDWIRRKTSKISATDVTTVVANPPGSTAGGEPSASSASWLQLFMHEAGLKEKESRTTYAVEVLEPLLVPVLHQALVRMPADPCIFILDCLFAQLKPRVPTNLVELFHSWSKDFQQEVNGARIEIPGSISVEEAGRSFSPVVPSASDSGDRNVALERPCKSHSERPSKQSSKEALDVLLRQESEDVADFGEEEPRGSRPSPEVAGEEDGGDMTSSKSVPAVKPEAVNWMDFEEATPSSSSKARSSNDAGVKSLRLSDELRSEQITSPATARRTRPRLHTEHVMDAKNRSPSGRKELSDAIQKASEDSKGLGAEAWRRRQRRLSTQGLLPNPEQQKATVPIAQVEATLKQIPLFDCCSPVELQALAEECEVRSAQEDEQLISWGQQGSDLFILHSGTCTVSTLQPDSVIRAGSYFGEELLFSKNFASQRHITASGTSEEPLIALCLTREKLQRLNLLSRLKMQRRKKVNVVSRAKAVDDDDESFMMASVEEEQDEDDAAEMFGAPVLRATTMSLRSKGCRLPHGQKGKSDAEIVLIMDAVRSNPQLMDVLQLDDVQVRLSAELVTLVEVPKGTRLCEAGEVLDQLFIVQEGVFELHTADGKCASKLRAGQSFGDLGLLYGSASPHSVVAAAEGKAWRLNASGLERLRQANLISGRSASARILRRVPLFKDLDDQMLIKLADALDEICFVRREEVLAAGSTVRCLYLVISGSLEVGGSRVVQAGDYFGLEEMLKGRKSSETFKVESEKATVQTLDASSLELVLATSLKELAKRHKLNSKALLAEDPQGAGVITEFSREVTGEASEVSDHISVPARVPSFDVPRDRLKSHGVLGKGSFGLVTLQEDTETGQWYALKAMSKGYCVQSDTTAMVLQEKNMHMLLDSPFVVRLYTTYKDDKFLYFLLEAATGGELFEVYQVQDDFFGSAAHARFYAAGVALGLRHMHSKKVIYRDLKLENILLNEKGYPLLSDMGLAKLVLGKTYTCCGTADYMAPEILRRTGHGRAVDWWALGIIIHIMMTGVSPFDAAEPAQIYRNIVRGLRKEHFPDSMGADLVDVVKGLCRKKPEERLPMGPKALQHLFQAPWFQSLDLAALEQLSLPAPWLPPAKTAAELTNGQDETLPAMAEYEDDGSGWDKDF